MKLVLTDKEYQFLITYLDRYNSGLDSAIYSKVSDLQGKQYVDMMKVDVKPSTKIYVAYAFYWNKIHSDSVKTTDPEEFVYNKPHEEDIIHFLFDVSSESQEDAERRLEVKKKVFENSPRFTSYIDINNILVEEYIVGKNQKIWLYSYKECDEETQMFSRRCLESADCRYLFRKEAFKPNIKPARYSDIHLRSDKLLQEQLIDAAEGLLEENALTYKVKNFLYKLQTLSTSDINDGDEGSIIMPSYLHTTEAANTLIKLIKEELKTDDN